MRKFLIAIFVALQLLGLKTAAAAEEVIVRLPAQAEYSAVKEGLQMAVANHGLKVSGTLHISEMLNRTGADLGFEQPVYQQAEALEFCSALISHKMTQASSLNLAVCPFTIAVYILAAEPEQVYLAYRKPRLSGDPEGLLTQEILDMLAAIATEASEGF